MKVSKDLSVTKNNEGKGVVLFSAGLGKSIVIMGWELPKLIEALQAELISQEPREHAADCAINVGMLGECDCGVED